MNSRSKNVQTLQILTQIITNTCTQTQLFSQFLLSHCIPFNNLSLPSLLLRHLPIPNPWLWARLLRHCIHLPKPIPLSQSLHCQILKLGLSQSLFIQTTLLNFYSKNGLFHHARNLFVEMPERDAIANNAMIAAFADANGGVNDARSLFDSMPVKSSAAYNSMITCYCKANAVKSAREIFDMNPDKNIVSWNAMIDGYCKTGDIATARELFDIMGPVKDSITWNTMISGYLHRKEFRVAISMFQKMQVENVKPSEVTMASLLLVCSHLGALDTGKWIHAYIRNHRIKIDFILGNALIDMYFKCGSVETALEVFNSMPVKNIFCWNSVISGLGSHGFGEQAIDAFLEMEKDGGIKIDEVTFISLLSACSHSGLVSEGKMLFAKMFTDYGLQPKIEHYGCITDLLSRAGLLEEALNFVNTMPIRPNYIIWGSLLRACELHKNITISEQVMNKLLKLDCDDGGNHVLFCNVYASMNRWDRVERCRRVMYERGVCKLPGCSCIVVKGVVHEFVAGDTKHAQFDQISNLLVEISREVGDQASEDFELESGDVSL